MSPAADLVRRDRTAPCGRKPGAEATCCLHTGVSSREDLPLPSAYALTRAGLAVIVSFVAAAAVAT